MIRIDSEDLDVARAKVSNERGRHEQDEEFYEEPKVTLKRLRQLEAAATCEVETLQEMMAKS
jgi:hypothetical protein